jgi:hypothetical protein
VKALELYSKLCALAAPSSGATDNEREVARRKVLELRQKHGIQPAQAFCSAVHVQRGAAWAYMTIRPEGTVLSSKGALRPRPELNQAWAELVAIGAALAAWRDAGRPDPVVVRASSWAVGLLTGRELVRPTYAELLARLRTLLGAVDFEVSFQPAGERNPAESEARRALPEAP